MDRTLNLKDVEVSNIGQKEIEDAQSFRDASTTNYSETETRKIIRKIDRRLLAICGSMVAVSLLDRSNLSNAYIAGMGKELTLGVGSRYSIIVLIFFAPYIAFQLPGAVLVKKLGPRWTLPAMTMAWGVLVIGFGFAKNWTVLVGLRILLGILEAGLFPGVIYLISLWYTRYDMAKRYATNFMIGSVGSAFGGILAYAFMQMDGLGAGSGIKAWQWIFVMEGILTCFIAFLAFWLLIGYPHDPKAWKFLSNDELNFIIHRIEADRHDTEADQKFSLVKFLRPAADPRIWGYGILYTCSTSVAYAVAYFLPMILNSEIGFSVGVSQILTTPPYIFAAIQMYTQAWWSDKKRLRSPFLIANALEVTVGLCLLAWTTIPGVKLLGVFLVTAGCNSNVPLVLSWQANNIRGHWTRTFCSATLTGMGALGGIVGATTFRAQDAPKYRLGIYASLTANGIVILVTLAMAMSFKRANKEAEQGKKVIAELPGFRYTL